MTELTHLRNMTKEAVKLPSGHTIKAGGFLADGPAIASHPLNRPAMGAYYASERLELCADPEKKTAKAATKAATKAADGD